MRDGTLTMATRSAVRAFRCLNALPASRYFPSHRQYVFPTAPSRFYSSDASATPPLLTKLKGDLKTAMREKDKARLAVLRSIINATSNAAKTSTPIRTDPQLVGLLRKNVGSGLDAVKEFRDAGRADLVEKEQAQIEVLNQYIAESGVQTLSGESLQGMVDQAIAQARGQVPEKSVFAEVMKSLNAAGGPLEGKDVDKAELVGVVKKSLS